MLQGKIEFLEFTSKILETNPLKDPITRHTMVYLPPNYGSEKQSYPVVYGLPGFSGIPESYLSKSMFKPSLDQIIDQLIVSKQISPIIYAVPDCTTKYGGSQYVNSIAVGNYEDYIVKEIVPFIDTNLRTTGKRAVMGGSSGGIGAFTLAAKYPNIFSAFASHSGDSAFEYCFFKDFAKFVIHIGAYNNNLQEFLNAAPDILPKDEKFMTLMIILACAACYSPNPKTPLGFDLPFDHVTGEIYPEIWKKWLAFDPVHMVAEYVENLKQLKKIVVDCGKYDQFNLHVGARQLSAKLKKYEIDHHYEEYEGDHFVLRREQKRKSIPMLVKALMD